MINPFTHHVRQQGLTYCEHASFALAIAWRLFNTVVIFTLHGLFPFIHIEPRLDLEATGRFIEQQNRWIENAKQRPAATQALFDSEVKQA